MTNYHFIGIGGTGLSAIARVLFERGHDVSGSDMTLSPPAQELIDLGIPVKIGHSPENITNADLIIRSSAIPDDNPEVIEANKKKIPVLKRRDFLSELTKDSKVIAIAGTHGKTTTTAMIAWCLTYLGKKPSYVIGSTSKNLGTNAHADTGEYFVIEADEYDYMFFGLNPDVLVITNIEYDHPDCFPTEMDYYRAFLDMTLRIKPGGVLVACVDNQDVKQLIEESKDLSKIVTYGTSKSTDFRIESVEHTKENGISFSIKRKNSKLDTHVGLSISGSHNALNATGTIAVMDILAIPISAAIPSLAEFNGTSRRFDILGTTNGITIIDDYAHHPTEIAATLSAARNRYPKRNIWVVWQPHTYSRTLQLSDQFTTSFNECDHMIATEIYASREKYQPYSSKSIIEKMDHPDARFIPHLNDVTQFLTKNLAPDDVLLVLTAGDANQISREVLDHFLRKENS